MIVDFIHFIKDNLKVPKLVDLQQTPQQLVPARGWHKTQLHKWDDCTP